MGCFLQPGQITRTGDIIVKMIISDQRRVCLSCSDILYFSKNFIPTMILYFIPAEIQKLKFVNFRPCVSAFDLCLRKCYNFRRFVEIRCQVWKLPLVLYISDFKELKDGLRENSF